MVALLVFGHLDFALLVDREANAVDRGGRQALVQALDRRLGNVHALVRINHLGAVDQDVGIPLGDDLLAELLELARYAQDAAGPPLRSATPSRR